MTKSDPDQDLVAAALSSAPPVEVSPSFLARVNARIDAEAIEEEAGWLAIADFRAWTLRLVPAAAAMALIAALWSGGGDSTASSPSSPSSSSPSTISSASTGSQTFTPSSAGDWQRDVSGNALLEAALTGGNRVR
jgi:hypothetical protein